MVHIVFDFKENKTNMVNVCSQRQVCFSFLPGKRQQHESWCWCMESCFFFFYFDNSPRRTRQAVTHDPPKYRMFFRNVGPRIIFNVEEAQAWVSSSCEARMFLKRRASLKDPGVALRFLFQQEGKVNKIPAILFVMDVSLAA